MKYWQVTVVFEIVSDSGRNQKVKELYLVEAVSATDAEAKITKQFFGVTLDWEITNLKKSNIIEILK